MPNVLITIWAVLGIACVAAPRPPAPVKAPHQLFARRDATDIDCPRDTRPARAVFERGRAVWCKDTAGTRRGPYHQTVANGRRWVEGYYEDGVEHGRWTRWHRTTGAMVSSRGYWHGQPHGEWQTWSPAGALIETATYRYGTLDGEQLHWYADGTVRRRAHYREGIRHGVWETWRPDGTPRARGAFADGREDGEWVTYDERGRIISAGAYEDGARHGPWRIVSAARGEIVTGRYDRGVRDGIWVTRSGFGLPSRIAVYRDGHHMDATLPRPSPPAAFLAGTVRR